jgi:hypothetical protein
MPSPPQQSRRQKRCGSFYVVDQSDYGNSGNQRVTIALYKDDAPKADAPKNRVINGIVELPKDQAIELEPYDTVTVQGFYRSQPEVNDAITKAAKAKDAYAFYIVRQVDANQGGNQRITAFIYKQMRKNAFCKARMLFQPTLKLAALRSRKAVKKRRKLRSQALQRPQHQVLKWVVSLKRNPPRVVATL